MKGNDIKKFDIQVIDLLFKTLENDNEERVGHREYHPNINHLYVPSDGQFLRYSKKTETFK